ncbi:DeoR/GlpR transcriptional regulator [Aureimonas flava]|uniref:DeoR/GlpR transcriptional regulator n=1 Tax=Aureimonas flava TaxID=2320271 RepID=A0A3A1WJU2_9HYPH|nr:DeoR/GlpR family DNA-binding transcription regulator [Aureimonas flava]RIY00149.1 DeoR/GlpR transcriptional regulator [Aureimonas flava]
MGDASLPHLLAEQRQAVIREWLTRDGRVLASQLAASFGVSEDTVRRDLRELAARDECRRVYGGALPLAPLEGPLGQRMGQDRDRKARLGRAIACTIMPGSSLFIDAGSTNLAVAEALPPDAGLTVITNAPAIACALQDRGGLSVVLLGGRLDPASGACLGAQTMREAERMRPSVLVLGACGIDAKAGVTSHDLEEADLKALLAARAGAIVVAATNGKIGTAASFQVTPVDGRVHLFVEHDCPEAALEPFGAAGASITRAGADAASRRRPAAVSRKDPIR